MNGNRKSTKDYLHNSSDSCFSTISEEQLTITLIYVYTSLQKTSYFRANCQLSLQDLKVTTKLVKSG